VGQYKVCTAGSPANIGNVCTTNGNCGTGGVCSNNITNATAPCALSAQIGAFALEFGGLAIALENVQVSATYGSGTPAGTLMNGLLRGFLPESDADQVKLDLGSLSSGAINGGFTLSQLLAGPDKCDGGTNHGGTCSNDGQCPANPGDPAPQCVGGFCDSGANQGIGCTTVAQCPLTKCRVSCAPAGFGLPPAGTIQDDRDENPPDPANDNKSGWWFYLNVEAAKVNHVLVP
jgi:hypothetical protein